MSEENHHILYVEDSQDNQILIQFYTADLPIVLSNAPDAESALELLHEHKPELILLDLNLPGQLSGMDLLRKLRTSDDCRDIPVVIISAFTQQHLKDELKAFEGVQYLSKPFKKAAFRDLLESLLPEMNA